MTVEANRKNSYRFRKGIAHVHTTFSHDGEISLERLATVCRTGKIDFALISEHAQDVDEKKFAQLIRDANRLSGKGTLLVPGLEYEGEQDIHLLAYGITAFIDPKKTLCEIAEQVHKNGGLNVIAHPKRNGYVVPQDILPFLNGIEIWNTKMDGSSAPNVKSLSLLRSVRSQKENIFGYTGLDLHWQRQNMKAFIHVPISCVQKDRLFWALEEGNFVLSGSRIKLTPRGDLPFICDGCFTMVNAFNAFFNFVAKKLLYRNLKKILGDGKGESLKRHLRRFL